MEDEEDAPLKYFKMPEGHIVNRKERARLAHIRRSKAAKKRWKPHKKRKEYVWDEWRGKGIKEASKAVYDALADACVAGMIAGNTHTLFRFPSAYKLPKGFPRGRKEDETEDYKTRNINLELLLEWLYNNGHASTSSKDVKKQIRDAERGING